MTIFSPHTVGRQLTRAGRSCGPRDTTESRPSCGMRRSAMSMSLMIFSREMTADWISLGAGAISLSTPSMRNRMRMLFSLGSTWMSDALSEIAWLSSRLT